MVRKKNEEREGGDWLKRSLERINKESPVVEEKYSVEEVTPAYNTGGYYDQDIPEEFVKVSGYFETKEEAEAWMDEHEADEGKFLAVRKHIAREMRTTHWLSVRLRRG